MLDQAAKVAASDFFPGKNFLLGAVCLRKDGAVVSAYNTTVPHHQTPSAHAEARVLRKSTPNSILWVARVLKDRKTWAMSRPCKFCRAAIENSGITRVYYTIAPHEYGVWIVNQNTKEIYG